LGEQACCRADYLEERVAALKEQIIAQARLIQELTTKVNNPATGTSKPVPGCPVIEIPAPIKGIVIIVDQELKLVQIDAGGRSGIKRGNVLDIVRGDAYVGRFRVDTVSEDTCCGLVILLATGQCVQVGDEASNSLN
jgi:hypothetical protein